MPMPRSEHRRIVRGFSVHPAVIDCVNREAEERNISRSRVVEDVLARHYGLGQGAA